MEKDFDASLWYVPFCNREEIKRIINPKNAFDFLLKKRADIIADNARYMRVYIRRREKKDYVGLESSFSDKHYLAFLDKLPQSLKEKCKNIAYGDCFYKGFNAYTESTPFGTMVYINESLYYFMYFINLAFLSFEIEVPTKVRLNALRIAIRIFLQNEAMDFDIDPRGIIPDGIHKKIDEIVFYEKQFIAGHEFSHFLCGHLNDCRTQKVMITKNQFRNENIYFQMQANEFEADLSSILLPNYSDYERNVIAHSALLFFVSLDITEYVDKIIRPGDLGYSDHPPAIERFERIKGRFFKDNQDICNECENMIASARIFKDFIKKDLDENFDQLDFYGSVYLDEPNTKWRGRQLIDRVDY